MEESNEANKKMSQSSIGQRSRNQTQYRMTQTRKTEAKPTHSTNASNNNSEEIELRQQVAMRENPGSARFNQSNESVNDEQHGNDDKLSSNNSNRRRGQNNAWYRNNNRGSSRNGYPNQDRRYNNARTNEDRFDNRNVRKQLTKGSNSLRGGRGRGRGLLNGDDNRNESVPLSQTNSSSPPPTEKQPAIAAKPNAWTDNAFPITKAFENTALKELLPANTEEENEMLERALQLSLAEERQHNSYNRHPVERKSSNSSETEVFVNEVEEARKMLQPNDFPPLLKFAPDSAISSPAGTLLPDADVVSQPLVKERLGVENSSVNLVRKSHFNGTRENEIDRPTPEGWDRFGARPKKKVPNLAGRGYGRGRKGSDGKIGELVGSSVSSIHSPLVASSASRTSPSTVKPKSPPNTLDLEQFESAELSSIIPKTDVGFCVTPNRTVTGVVPSLDDVQSADSSRELSDLSSLENVPQVQIASTAVKQVQVSSNLAQQQTIVGNVAQQQTILGNVAQQQTIMGNVAQQPTIVGNVAQQPTIVGNEAKQATVLNSVMQQETEFEDASQMVIMALAGAAQKADQMPLGIDIPETENGTAVEPQPQRFETYALEIGQSDQSKDEQIRALQEEVNRLKYGLDGNHHDAPAAHFPQSYGVLPLHVPYFLPMPCYRYPFPNVPLPIVRNDGAMFDSSFGPVSYMPNGQPICPQEMVQMQQVTIPAMCSDEASTLSPNLDVANRPDLSSSLSPTAEVFHPKRNCPAQTRNDPNFNSHEGRKQRPKQQHYNRRGNAKNFHGQFQNNYSPQFTFQSPPFPNSGGLQNSQLSLSFRPTNEHTIYDQGYMYDNGPPAY